MHQEYMILCPSYNDAVTEWQNASALSRAHEEGYYEGLKRQAESEHDA